MKTESALKKNIFRLLIITLGAAAIYGLPYFSYAFEDSFKVVFDLNDQEMANLQTAYGILALISYLPGGWIADRVSIKKLLLFSIFSTAATGLVLLLTPGYVVVLAIHGFWGISTILTFWPAFIKTVRSLANDSEQGRAFGIMEGSRGLMNAAIGAGSLAIFGVLIATSDYEAIQKVILFYAGVLVLVGVLVIFFVKDVAVSATAAGAGDQDPSTAAAAVDPVAAARQKAEARAIIIRDLKKPAIWIISGIVFCSYFMNIAFYNFTPFATDVLHSGPVLAATMVILAQWVRPLAAVSAGVLGDKISVASTVRIGFGIMTAGVIAVALIPTSASVVLFLVALSAIYIAMYALQANHFALLEEGNIHKASTGTAVGVISTLGYLPEVIASQVCLYILTRFGYEEAGKQEAAYDALFFFLAGLFVVGFILTIVWRFAVKAPQDRGAQEAADAEVSAA